MKFHMEGPSNLEAESVEVENGNAIVVCPTTVKGQHVVRACYITARGAGGTESRAVVLFNANTGEFALQKLGATAKVLFDFDKPKAEFIRKREALRKSGSKGQQIKQSNQAGASGDSKN